MATCKCVKGLQRDLAVVGFVHLGIVGTQGVGSCCLESER